ncbi:MAG TPA: SurA N-terminal domain-containing protein [bacterium]|nr:SurA N-terminal domain-containing protein [bacterium]
MFSRLKRAFFYTTAAAVFFTAGWACNKYGNVAGISDSAVVAVVGDHQITFKDWMRQTDLLRVFSSAPIDPDNKDQMQAVLDGLIDQEIILGAAQKSHFSSGAFDEGLKKKLQEADLKLKDLKDKLDKDLQTLHRLQDNYQDPYKKILLARQYANSQVDNVVVTEKDMRDWYANYSLQAQQMGQRLPSFEKVKGNSKAFAQMKMATQADKFLKDLEAATKVERKQDVIDKYLASLSISEKMLDSDNEGLSLDKKADSKDAGGK